MLYTCGTYKQVNDPGTTWDLVRMWEVPEGNVVEEFYRLEEASWKERHVWKHSEHEWKQLIEQKLGVTGEGTAPGGKCLVNTEAR